MYKSECTSRDEGVGYDWGEVVVCNAEPGELDGCDCRVVTCGGILSTGFDMFVSVL